MFHFHYIPKEIYTYEYELPKTKSIFRYGKLKVLINHVSRKDKNIILTEKSLSTTDAQFVYCKMNV